MLNTLKQWDHYISEHPDGYGLTQFRVAVQRYRLINNLSMRMEHNRRTQRGQRLLANYAASEGGKQVQRS